MRAITLIVILGLALAAPEAEKIGKLPECEFVEETMYSGYLNVENGEKSLHYFLTESQNDPANDPLLIWFNGGPGCSSLLGAFMEIGPCVVDDGETEFFKNPAPWNQKQNVLYIEQPAGVGYSFANASNPKNKVFNDLLSSHDNLAALKSFYEKFPEYQGRDLYISGESYAGIYVPYLAFRIH